MERRSKDTYMRPRRCVCVCLQDFSMSVLLYVRSSNLLDLLKSPSCTQDGKSNARPCMIPVLELCTQINHTQHTNTYTNTHTHALPHKHTYTHFHTHTHTLPHTHSHTCVRTHRTASLNATLCTSIMGMTMLMTRRRRTCLRNGSQVRVRQEFTDSDMAIDLDASVCVRVCV